MSFWGGIQDPSLTVDIHENAGSPHVECRDGRVKITREYWVPYSQRHQAVFQLLGGVIGTGIGFFHVRPHHDPEDTWLYAQGCSVDPFGGNLNPEHSTYCNYPKAKLTVAYEQPEYDLDGDHAYLSENLEGTAEFMTQPTKGLSWDEQGKQKLEPEEIAAYLRKMMTYSLTFHQMPILPPVMWSLWTKINKQAIYSPKYHETFAAGEMLFGLPKATEQQKDTGQRLYDIALTMTRMPGGWNNILRYIEYESGKFAFEPSPVFKGGAPYTPYKIADVRSVIPPHMVVT